MSILRKTIELLKDEWEEDPFNDREEPVPQPAIIEEGKANPRSWDYAQGDVIFVRDGGFPIIEPASVGFRDERVEVLLDIDIRTARGRQRLAGAGLDGSYTGLSGEVKRIFRKYRKGYEGYDIVKLETFSDEIGSYEANLYVGVWNVRLIKFASPIQQDAEVDR